MPGHEASEHGSLSHKEDNTESKHEGAEVLLVVGGGGVVVVVVVVVVVEGVVVIVPPGE